MCFAGDSIWTHLERHTAWTALFLHSGAHGPVQQPSLWPHPRLSEEPAAQPATAANRMQPQRCKLSRGPRSTERPKPWLPMTCPRVEWSRSLHHESLSGRFPVQLARAKINPSVPLSRGILYPSYHLLRDTKPVIPTQVDKSINSLIWAWTQLLPCQVYLVIKYPKLTLVPSFMTGW